MRMVKDCDNCVHYMLEASEKICRDCFDWSRFEINNINNLKHYNKHPSGIECIQITRHFNIANAIKYLWRAGIKKDADKTEKEKHIEDLKKAIKYIQDEINILEDNK